MKARVKQAAEMAQKEAKQAQIKAKVVQRKANEQERGLRLELSKFELEA